MHSLPWDMLIKKPKYQVQKLQQKSLLTLSSLLTAKKQENQCNFEQDFSVQIQDCWLLNLKMQGVLKTLLKNN